MRIRFTLPWGGEFSYEKQPMGKDRFDAMCLLSGAVAFIYFMFKLLTSA